MATPYIIGNQGTIYSVNVSTSAKTVTLPAASTIPGQFVILKDEQGFSGSNSCTISVSTTGLDRFEYENISCLNFSYPFGAWSLLNDGATKWFLTDEYLNTLSIFKILPPPPPPPFSPTDITGLLIWTDASTLELNDFDSLTTWTNGGSGGTVNCTGTFLTNQLNGLPIVQLGYTQTWEIDSQPTLSEYSMFFVTRQTGGINQRVLQSSSNDQLYGYYNGYKRSLYIDNDPSQLETAVSDTDWDLFSHTRVADSAYIFNWNGTTQFFSDFSSPNDLTGLCINTGANPSETSDCEVAEILLYDSVLTTEQVQQLEGYLAWKWGLQDNLPDNHPYKNSPP
jgi:hypothetical protein